MHRRTFMRYAGAATLWSAASARGDAPTLMPVIDCHIHVFDPTRNGGVPWPDKSDAVLYRPALPDRYSRISAPQGVVGAIAVECSPWPVDNFWLQDVIEKSPLLLGFVGNLSPEAQDFAATLDRLHRSPLFLGIRYGNLWNRSLRDAVEKPEFIAGLRLLTQAGLVLETANPDAALIAAVLRATDRVPELRVVVDHMPNAIVPSDSQGRAAYDSDLRQLSQRPQVFVKGSEILRRLDGKVITDRLALKAGLDQLWDLFGDDRMLFGSDWPNSDSVADYGEVFTTARDYIAHRSPSAREKYFWRNSRAVYRWQPRSAAQIDLDRAAIGSSPANGSRVEVAGLVNKVSGKVAS